MRIGVFESGMYKEMEGRHISKGDFLSLFTKRVNFFKYMNSILIGLPIWFAVGILVTFSPEFAKALGVSGPVNAGEAVMFCYLGLVFGDLASGFLSQYFGSRKKIVLLFQILSGGVMTVYFMLRHVSPVFFYAHCMAIGLAVGYWAIFITIAAEQFGTNLRATVASTVPNFVRGMVIPITFSFQFAKERLGIIRGGAVVGIICLAISLYALYHLGETYDKDLNYIEE
jgi:predicted membrane-bound spermidine synthase